MPARYVRKGKKRVRKSGKIIKKTTTVYRRQPRSKGIISFIKKVMNDNMETKQAYTTTGNSYITFNSGINSTGDMQQIIPNIARGTADNERIGDQIKMQSFYLRGHIKVDFNTSGASNQDLCNIVCRLMVLSLKPKANYTEASSSSTQLAGLLKKGGTTSNFSGYLQDIYAPINTDLYTVHADRKFYLNQSFMQNFNSTTNAIVSTDVKNTVKFFKIKIRCKNRLLKYDSNESSNLLPVNYGPFLCLGYSFLSGASPDVVSTRVGLCFDSILNYQDA